ncbi:protoporphyrinogen oxidase [Lentibacillus amyloliquefaciens]|uniref:Coproporphyrinogen III oxidase n=1 Tax=Lentibacillus amyloliquefaciens TaxID=1472767 RepID=A0A0U4FJ65_9BACI|nr:protoporphyrinogen oxidase [Lentibacillus amyloliquefaciens]ALX48686.1 protoporphyrinogen oxidase [Lentibacillus amyloliquefaciens]
MSEMKKILIAGGGITGLSAAYYLQKEINEKDLPYEVRLVEAGNRLGGKIKTTRRNGYVIEQGPDSFLSRKQPGVKLVNELGLSNQLVKNGTGQSYILVDNRLHKMPKGSYMGIPVRVRPFLFSGIFSPVGKLRAGMDFAKPRGKTGDQSLGTFFRRRFGNELVENLIEPLLSGIYAGDIDNMSIKATFPNFHQLEQEHRSLIKGLRKTTPKQPKQKKSGGKKEGIFYSFENGLETWVERLESVLGDSVSLGVGVDHVEKKAHGYHVLLSNGEVYKPDAVIMATPHNTLPNIFSQFNVFDEFKDIPATSVANVAMAFDASAIERDIDGTGFVVSRNSDFRITACTWTHKKWPNAVPEGKALVRCYVGKPSDQEVVDLSDEEITDIVMNDLNKTMNITEKPEFSVISRWKNAMPQYTVGHTERIANVRENMEENFPGVFIAGSSYEGVGIPDCIGQGEKAVNDVLDYLRD